MSAPRHLLSLCLLTVVAVARTPDDKAHAHQNFLQALKEASSIAHERKLNIDERPDFTTVLRGEELRGLGVRTLFDTLALVPGIQTSEMQNGIKNLFDADLYDRSYYGRHEGLPRPGRRLFFSVEFPL